MIMERVTCSCENVVYYILCSCGNPSDHVGSTFNIKRRWSKHKSDIRLKNWTACGLSSHSPMYHRDDMEEAISNLKVTLLDCVVDPNVLKKQEDKWICNLGTLLLV
jgi:predicted GIY-YIG superfamily endonuclease